MVLSLVEHEYLATLVVCRTAPPNASNKLLVVEPEMSKKASFSFGARHFYRCETRKQRATFCEEKTSKWTLFDVSSIFRAHWTS